MAKNDVFKKLELENKSTFPKIRMTKVFLNDVKVLRKKQTEKSDNYFQNDEYKKLPLKSVAINLIVPTQTNLTIRNLKSVKDISKNTEAFLYNYYGKFYVLDGHHRIAMNILKGEKKIKAFVFPK